MDERPIITQYDTMKTEMKDYPEFVTIDEVEKLISDVKESKHERKSEMLDELDKYLEIKKNQKGGTRRKKRVKKSRRAKRKSRR